MKSLFNKILLIFMSVVMASTLYTGNTLAYDSFYSDNDILFYDNTDDLCMPSQLVLSGKNNLEKIYNFLVGKGLNARQAAGVLGNIQHESGYSPTRHEQSYADFNAGGYGIAQWTYGRRTSLVEHLKRTLGDDFMTQYYNDSYSGSAKEADDYVPRNTNGELMPLGDNDTMLQAELDFLFQETSTRLISKVTSDKTSATRGDNEWESLKKATSIEDAAKIWLYNFEIPANIEQAAIDRTAAGEAILAKLQAEGAGPGSSTGCLNTSAGDIAALQATVKMYAWPDFHASGYVTLKPEYKEAVDKAVVNGGYVGGINYKGVDCGGFVTRVMIDSGFEPNYNSAKGNTETQKKWLDANWEKIGTGSTIDTATLQPGDVAIQVGHTFMFAGTNIDGFGKNTSSWKGVASASLDSRAPMAGLENMTDSSLTWYRKKVNIHE